MNGDKPSLANTYNKYSANNLRDYRAANDSVKNDKLKQQINSMNSTMQNQSSITASTGTGATTRS